MIRHRPLLMLCLCLLATLACRLADGIIEGDDTSPLTTAVATSPTEPAESTNSNAPPTKTAVPNTATAETLPADPTWRRFDDPTLGISFDYPAGWLVEPGESVVVVSPDLDTLNEPTLATKSVAIISVQGEASMTPADLVNISPDLIFTIKDMKVTDPTEAITLNGHEAAVSAYTGSINGQRRTVVVYGIVGETLAVLLLGATPEESDDGRLIAAIAESIALRPPVARPAPIADERLAIGDEVAGEIGDDRTITYAFSGSGGAFVTVVVEPDREFDAVIDLLDGNGNSLVSGEVDEAYDTETIAQIRLPQSGDYYVNVRGFGGEGGAFTLRISAAEAPIGGPLPTGDLPRISDDVAYAATLTDDTTHTYVFEATTIQPLTFIVDAVDDFDAVVTVYNGEGTRLTEGDAAFAGESEALQFVPPATGLYVVEVAGYLDQGGDYIVGMVAMESGSTALVRAGGAVSRETPGTHRFTLPEGQAALIAALPDSTLDVMIALWEDGILLVERDDISAGPGEIETHIYVGAGGNLTLELSGFAASAGNYQVVVTAVTLLERP